MATFTGPNAAATYPCPSLPVPRGAQGVSWGYYNHTANLAAASIVEYCKVPKGATIIGGFWQAADLDTGTEELDVTIGWAANGVDDADPDGFGALGVTTGDVSVHMPVAGVWIPFINIIQSAGFKTFAAETKLTLTVATDAAMGGTGISKMVAWFV